MENEILQMTFQVCLHVLLFGHGYITDMCVFISMFNILDKITVHV